MNTPRDIARELARKYSTMTHDELDILESVLVPMKFAKGETILKDGDVCKNIYYIDKGLIRQYYFKNGKDMTEHLGADRSIFMCIESLFKEIPSHLQVDALETSIIYALPKKTFGAGGTAQREHSDSLSQDIGGESYSLASAC